MTKLIGLKIALYHELIKQDMNKLNENDLDLAVCLSTDRDIRDLLTDKSNKEILNNHNLNIEVKS